MPRSIKKEIHLEIPIQDAFNALILPSKIKQWWLAASAVVLPEENGTYAVAWGDNEDDPDYISVATISEIRPPQKLVLTDYKYRSKSGNLPFEADIGVKFLLEERGSGTLLTVEQTGFPDDPVADEFLQGCVKGWNDTLASFKKIMEKPASTSE